MRPSAVLEQKRRAPDLRPGTEGPGGQAEEAALLAVGSGETEEASLQGRGIALGRVTQHSLGSQVVSCSAPPSWCLGPLLVLFAASLSWSLWTVSACGCSSRTGAGTRGGESAWAVLVHQLP